MDRYVRRRLGDISQDQSHRLFVAAPGPNAMMKDLPGFPWPPDWAGPFRPFLSAWREAGVEATFLLPCGGIDGPGQAMEDIALRWRAYSWDIDPAVGPALRRSHRSCVVAAVGPVAGDILRLRCADVPLANMLVGGPPCPPWSALGVRNSFGDPRALVFWKVCDMIVDQATRQRPQGWQHAFWAFILENVEGMLNVSAESRAEGSDTSPMHEIVEVLQSRLGDLWRLEVEVVHTSDGGLPQKRSRPYLRGTRKDLMDLTPLPPLPPSLLRGGYDLGTALRMDLPHTNKVSAGKGNKYMDNLAKYKKSFEVQCGILKLLELSQLWTSQGTWIASTAQLVVATIVPHASRPLTRDCGYSPWALSLQTCLMRVCLCSTSLLTDGFILWSDSRCRASRQTCPWLCETLFASLVTP